MPLAHKLTIYTDEAYKPTVYCSVCGHEENLNGICPGKYQLSSKEQIAIDDALENGFKKNFGSKTEYGSKYLREVLDSRK